MTAPVVLANVLRNGAVESVHRGHVALVDAGAGLLAAAGNGDHEIYPRSAVKPLQAAAVLDLLPQETLSSRSVAIASASHTGTDEHQIEAAFLLAIAGLDEEALGCPPDLPADKTALRQATEPTRLAHNCSGKHAAFLLAQTRHRAPPDGYLDVASPIQEQVAARLADATGARLVGPGVDGCGAPAWRLPLHGLAAAFAQLAIAEDGSLGLVREAMNAHPLLVGGRGAVDTTLMLGGRVVAKRGAEGVLAAGAPVAGRGLGIAVKVEDGSGRACGPVVATILRALGVPVPDGMLEPPVLGGGVPQGSIAPAAAVEALVHATR